MNAPTRYAASINRRRAVIRWEPLFVLGLFCALVAAVAFLLLAALLDFRPPVPN
ncbi:MAG TPA: hypothetical protein VJ783_17840 [Pirellulales bacterium]|nr:hypothetical protein [Pirellulales bacterium]